MVIKKDVKRVALSTSWMLAMWLQSALRSPLLPPGGHCMYCRDCSRFRSSLLASPLFVLCCVLPQAEEMINEIRSEFKDSLDNLRWMDDQTRQAAKDKVGWMNQNWLTDTNTHTHTGTYTHWSQGGTWAYSGWNIMQVSLCPGDKLSSACLIAVGMRGALLLNICLISCLTVSNMCALAPGFPQADAIYDMIGFPDFILDPKELDDVYDGVRTHRCPLSFSPTAYTDWWSDRQIDRSLDLLLFTCLLILSN